MQKTKKKSHYLSSLRKLIFDSETLSQWWKEIQLHSDGKNSPFVLRSPTMGLGTGLPQARAPGLGIWVGVNTRHLLQAGSPGPWDPPPGIYPPTLPVPGTWAGAGCQSFLNVPFRKTLASFNPPRPGSCFCLSSKHFPVLARHGQSYRMSLFQALTEAKPRTGWFSPIRCLLIHPVTHSVEMQSSNH